jgi:hypothetical protein
MTNSLDFAKELAAKYPADEELMNIPQFVVGKDLISSIASAVSYMRSEGLNPDTLICSEYFWLPMSSSLWETGVISDEEYTDRVLSSMGLSRLNMKGDFLWIVDSTATIEGSPFSTFILRS